MSINVFFNPKRDYRPFAHGECHLNHLGGNISTFPIDFLKICRQGRAGQGRAGQGIILFEGRHGQGIV